MKNALNELKEKARMKIIDKIRGEKPVENIEPYTGENSTYTSNDKDYKEFLENLNIITSESEPAEVDLEKTMKFNIKKACDEVKEALKENAVKQEEPEVNEELCKEICEDVCEDILATKYVNVTDDKISSLANSVEHLTAVIENQDIRRERSLDKIQNELALMKNRVDELKLLEEKLHTKIQDVTKVSDSVFDLKNTVQSTKTSMVNLETSFNRLKKKFVACMTLMSVLAFVVVILEILNLLS